ncbi:hypothetical protein [Streptomyces sp. TBY4]|uniref:hypothetical protein n=1 Tax=Streptomyces sp. TBY4 TaxID=2962030 RepID=UPI0020B7D175|nr:hypothetical protein [Streptomyces sp. TBY4]MCP3757227.1 hypothetical protein [Streptomyces sp. TBY4]
MATTVLAIAIVLAALVIRTAVAELRVPGSGRGQWSFLSDRRALATGAATAVLLGWVGWAASGPAATAWAVLAGLLTAAVVPPDGRDD